MTDQHEGSRGQVWYSGANIGAPSEKVIDLVQKYLATVEGPDGQPTFAMRRTGDVDALLCRWVIDGDDTTEDLVAAIRSARGRSRAGGEELSPQWKRQTARRLEQIDAVDQRLLAYVQAYWEEERSLYGFDDDEVTLPPDDQQRLPSIVGEADPEAPAAHAAHVAPAAHAALSSAASGKTAGYEDPAAAEITRLRAEVARLQALVGAASGPPDHLEARLEEEVSRAYRGLGRLSVLLVELLGENAPARAIDDSLRQYDTLCVLGPRQFGIILPGADSVACEAVETRVRLKLSLLGGSAVATGKAYWPEDGNDARTLLELAGRRLLVQRDGTAPPDPSAEPAVEPTSVWFEGWPQRLEGAQLARTREGLRLRVPLSFLREGSGVHLTRQAGGALRATVRRALVGPQTSNKVPILQLDLDRGGPQEG